jgi:hypothetical protein
MAESVQFSLFKNSVARHLLRHPEMNVDNDLSPSDTSALDEFATYLATESWRTQPQSVIQATYENRHKVPDIDLIPLEVTSTAFVDTLISYGLASDTDEALIFLRKALSDYIEHACSPPPVWSSTRTTECEICEREVPLTYHHLIPRSTHHKVLKKGLHPETMLNSVAWLCRCVTSTSCIVGILIAFQALSFYCSWGCNK